MANEDRLPQFDRAKIKTLEKLKEAGFDTAAKISVLDARQMLKLIQGLDPGMGIERIIKNLLAGFFKKEIHINKGIVRHSDPDVIATPVGKVENSSGFHGDMSGAEGVFSAAGEHIDKAVAVAAAGGIVSRKKNVFCYTENGGDVADFG